MKNIETSFISFAHVLKVLLADKACREFLEQLRWAGEPVCPHCRSKNKKHYELKAKGVFDGLRRSKDCRERFTVRVGTMFEDSHIPFRKWFMAIDIFSSHKKGINAFHNHSIEGFWSLLKRGIFRTYHSARAKHLNKYYEEFSYRHNTRNVADGNRFNLSLVNADDRLSYKQLIAK